MQVVQARISVILVNTMLQQAEVQEEKPVFKWQNPSKYADNSIKIPMKTYDFVNIKKFKSFW